MSSFADIQEFRKYLSDKQNEFYSDDDLKSIIFNEQSLTCENLLSDISIGFDLEAFFAGKSGGWVEVQYEINFEIPEKDWKISEIDNELSKAEDLEQLEEKVHLFISCQHKKYNEYLGSKEYYLDLKENILGDEEIIEIYQEQIKKLEQKIN